MRSSQEAAVSVEFALGPGHTPPRACLQGALLSPEKLFAEGFDRGGRDMARCFCPCHTHPGTYPPPCGVCGHDTREGRMVGGYRDGWEPIPPPPPCIEQGPASLHYARIGASHCECPMRIPVRSE